MRHRKAGRQLGRKRAPRKALLRNLATDLISRGAIVTTEAKGKSLRTYVERLVTLSKNKPHLRAKQVLQGKLFGKEASAILLKKYKEKYKDRSGGYVRILKLGQRSGDKAPMVKVEWV